MAIIPITRQAWITSAWSKIPSYRDVSIGHQQPLNLQFSGDLTDLKLELQRQGWKESAEMNWQNLLLYLNLNIQTDFLPVLPHIYRGRHEDFTMIKNRDKFSIDVVRFWESHLQLQTDGLKQNIYVGNLTRLNFSTPLRIVFVPKTDKNFNRNDMVLRLFKNLDLHKVKTKEKSSDIEWDGSIYLLQIPSVHPKAMP